MRLTSFISYADDCPFPLENLPYGIFSDRLNSQKRVGVAIGDQLLDLLSLANEGLITSESGLNSLDAQRVFSQPTLNAFISNPRPVWIAFRAFLQTILHADSSLANDGLTRSKLFHSQAEVTMHLPLDVGDYTDFFASEDHMINAATIFLGSRDNAMLPNWSHVPMAYHGRSSTIIVSGDPIARPVGQTRPGPSSDGIPCFGPTSQLDYELEVGYVIGGPANARGDPIPLSRARDRIFGAVLLNDWSARDIQAWESYPLGPFLGKNFATTISAWVVQAEALDLAAFACEPQAPAPLPYLQEREPTTWDLEVVAEVRGAKEEWTRTSVSNLKTLRWTATQMITHHSVGGCSLRPGDLLGTGTISGNTVESLGCLLERTRGGTETWSLKDGQKRTWLEDGDRVRLLAHARSQNGARIGFGEAEGMVQSASYPPSYYGS